MRTFRREELSLTVRERECSDGTVGMSYRKELSHNERVRVRVTRKRRMRVVALRGRGGEHKN